VLLGREAESLQKQIEVLKYAKSGMPESEYEQKLEDLLVRLAQVNSRMRKK
jgi:translation initiation factor IF-1